MQRGSPESKEEPGPESDRDAKVGRYAPKTGPRWAKVGGWRTALYSYSLLIVTGFIFLAAWAGQSVTGWTAYNHDQREHGSAALSWLEYVQRPSFWEETFQNWQSEFLAVGSMAIFAVYLRARGASESKPVGTPHDATRRVELSDSLPPWRWSRGTTSSPPARRSRAACTARRCSPRRRSAPVSS